MAVTEATGRLVAPDLSATPHEALFAIEGRVAVITGAARGIGLAIAKRLSGAGAVCVLTDVDESEAAAAAKTCSPKAEFEILDVRDEQQVNALAAGVSQRHGRLDIWVNNAGIFPRQDPLDTSKQDVSALLEVNVIGVQLGMQAAAREMRRMGRGGVIVNVASTAGFRGAGPYSASKWAVRGLTQGLAPVVGPAGIRVVAVAPSLTETAGLASYVGGDDEAAGLVESVGAKLPLGRMGVPDDTARVVLFLASDAASFITGQTLVVDGGSLSAM